MSPVKKITATVFMTLAVVASSTSMASAAPAKKCAGNPENFQTIGKQCVSDGRAEKL